MSDSIGASNDLTLKEEEKRSSEHRNEQHFYFADCSGFHLAHSFNHSYTETHSVVCRVQGLGSAVEVCAVIGNLSAESLLSVPEENCAGALSLISVSRHFKVSEIHINVLNSQPQCTLWCVHVTWVWFISDFCVGFGDIRGVTVNICEF